jgi:hypothetical protein
MPIPSNQVRYAEVKMFGIADAEGSSDHPFTFSFYFQRANLALGISKAQIEAIFQTNIALPIMAALNVDAIQTFNTVRFPDDALDPPLQVTRTTPGLITGDALPKANTAYLLLRTTNRGRSYRGSKHLFPLSESDTTAGSADLLNTAAKARFTTIATAINAVMTDAGGNVWTSVILSRKNSQLTINPTAIVATPVNAVLVNSRIGRMSKREPRSVY